MGVGYIRVLFLLAAGVVGHQIGSGLYGMNSQFGLIGAGLGCAVAAVVITLEKLTARVSLRGLTAAVFGLLLALIIANLISAAIATIEMDGAARTAIKISSTLILAYLGIVFSMRGRDEFNVIIPYVKFQRQDQSDTPVILDTSAIVDGRIADLIQTNFVDGYFVIPRFILKELQQIADSADPLKRARGKRGLDILARLKKNHKFVFKINNEEFEDTIETDQKLLKLARVLDARLMTTDHNLNRIAEFNSVRVLNLNDLSNALKPQVLPGERLEIQPVKEGKERSQAIGYLNDGTMVVVEDGRTLMGQNITVEVTSVFQTLAGRMIFSKPITQ
jgi:uncharacterized protein YacL